MERSPTTQNNKSYLSRVGDQAHIQRVHSTVGSLSEPELGNTKAFYINRHGSRQVWVGPLDLGVLRRSSHRVDCDSYYLYRFTGVFKAGWEQECEEGRQR